MAGRPLRRLRNAANRSMVEFLVVLGPVAFGSVDSVYEAAKSAVARGLARSVSFRATSEGAYPALAVRFVYDILDGVSGREAKIARLLEGAEGHIVGSFHVREGEEQDKLMARYELDRQKRAQRSEAFHEAGDDPLVSEARKKASRARAPKAVYSKEYLASKGMKRRNPDRYMDEDYRVLGALLRRQSEWNARLRSAEERMRDAQREADAYYVFSGGLSSGISGWRSSIVAPLVRDALSDFADGQLPDGVLQRVASLAEVYRASSMSDAQVVEELRRQFKLSNPREVTTSHTPLTTPGGAWYGIIYQAKGGGGAGGYRSPEVAKAILGPFKKKSDIPTYLGQYSDGGHIRAVKLTSPMPNWMRKLPHLRSLVATYKTRR